ncbi:hypothetical protein LZ30DRAFT_718588 [Colletotrichum cereale]|nr:hypothetical protein LZ30DRAFT_718588 [Colletotrichum cereale]
MCLSDCSPSPASHWVASSQPSVSGPGEHRSMGLQPLIRYPGLCWVWLVCRWRGCHPPARSR